MWWRSIVDGVCQLQAGGRAFGPAISGCALTSVLEGVRVLTKIKMAILHINPVSCELAWPTNILDLPLLVTLPAVVLCSFVPDTDSSHGGKDEEKGEYEAVPLMVSSENEEQM
jgi:hypothetical protein